MSKTTMFVCPVCCAYYLIGVGRTRDSTPPWHCDHLSFSSHDFGADGKHEVTVHIEKEAKEILESRARAFEYVLQNRVDGEKE